MSSEMRDEIACEIVRNVCETDPADPDAPKTVCIDVTRLREIVDNALLARTEAGAVEKRAPVQRYHGKTIPWRVHGLAWEAYAKKYGSSQSAERIAERGGFGVGEMDEFLPGWREMAEGTHPQDASGDAEIAMLRDTLRKIDDRLTYGMDRAGSSLERKRTMCDAVALARAAMQAKEAK